MHWEIMMVTMQSGCFVNERSTSSTYTALLTKQLVLDANKEEPRSDYEVRRMIGGGFLDSLKSSMGTIKKYGEPVAKMACKVIGSGEEEGAGITGGGLAGAGLMSDALGMVGLGKGQRKRKMHPLDSRI